MKSSDVTIIGHKFPKMVKYMYTYVYIFIKYDTHIYMIYVGTCMSQQLQSRLCEVRKKFMREGKNNKRDRVHLEEEREPV